MKRIIPWEEISRETVFSGELKSILSYHDCAYSTRMRYYFLATHCKKMQDSENNFGLIFIPLKELRKNILHQDMTDLTCALVALQEL